MFPFAFFALWALVLIWPLPLYLLTHIPLGNEKVGTVPFFNLWTLQWNIDQFTHGYPNYWDAPIFAPLTGTFAFSDIQPLSAFLAMPFWLGLQSAALGYNSTVILFLTLNGWFAYSLLRQWRRSFLVALSTGLIMQSLPFVAGQMGVLQLIAIFGFLWSLLFLSRFLVQSSSGKASWPTVSCLALGPPITFFTCSYYGLFSLLFLSLAFVFQLRPEHFKPKTLGVFLLAGLLSLILTGPLLWVQHEKLSQYGFGRTLQTIEENSARLSYYTSFLDYNLFYGQILGIRSGSGERLFPGIGLMLLATLGLFGRWHQRIRLYLIMAVIIALILSLGLRFQVGGFEPYQWLLAYVPGFAQLRSPFRFAVFVQIHLVLLAGFGLANLRHWISNKRLGLIILLSSTIIVLFESLALPLPLQPMPSLERHARWQNWLNQLDRPPRLVMLPFSPSTNVVDFEQTTLWMLESRYFQGQMLNGYSGFFPNHHASLRKQMFSFPSFEGVRLLRQMQVDYVIVHDDLAFAPAPELILKYLPLVYHDSQYNVSIYALNQLNKE